MVKDPPAVQETRVPSLGWEDSPGGGHGNPLQYTCLENPIYRKAWLATVHRVARVDSNTKQKRKHHQSLKTSEVIGESHTVQRTVVPASSFLP